MYIVADITQHQQIRQELEHRLEVEKALALVCSILAGEGDADLDEVLAILGRAVGASRAYIFEFRDDNRRMDNTHEWCAPGVEPQMGILRNLESSTFPWWLERLQRNESIIIPDVSALPDEASAERDILQAQAIRSVLAVPMSTGTELRGFLGFDDTLGTRKWSEDDVRLLGVASKVLVAHAECKRAKRELEATIERLHRTLDGTVRALARAAELRDPYTAGHQERVSSLACAIACEMGLSESQIKGIGVSAILHDIGKISVASEILSKPGWLSDIEFRIIMTHPRVGYDILKVVEFPWPVADIVLQHHERINGSGYPSGLSGEEILLEARILAVADVVEAMSSHRLYRGALGLGKALAEISRNRGVLYDARVVDACLNIFNEGESCSFSF